MKKIQIAVIFAFVAMLVAPSVIWFGLGLGAHSKNSENRALKEFPDLSQESYLSLFPDLDAWYKDSVPFKNDAVSLLNSIDYALFENVESDRTFVGKNGWLFYKYKVDGDPLNEYKGLNAISEEEMADCLDIISAAKSNLEAQDVSLYMLIAPNKEIAFREYVPETYKVVSTETRAAKLERYLTDHGVTLYDYMLDEMRPDGKNDRTYYQLDTHWNYLGGYYGYQRFMEMMEVSDDSALSFHQEETRGGDLASTINLDLPEMNNLVPDEEPRYSKLTNPDTFAGNDDIAFFESLEPDRLDQSLLVVSDSFRAYVHPFLASKFAKTVSCHRRSFDLDALIQTGVKPDVILFLSPERTLSQQIEELKKLATVRF